jgi:hypothetical protein
MAIPLLDVHVAGDRRISGVAASARSINARAI